MGPRLALYRGDGHGRFSDATSATGLDRLKQHFLGCAVGDYDNDGHDDLYLSAYRGGMLLHNENGFRDVTQAAGIPPQPWGAACGFADLNGDGKLDLYIGNYVQFGRRTEPQLCEYSGHMSACGPRFYQPEKASLFWNAGGGMFHEATRAWGAHQATGKALGVAFADFDASGRQSLAIANDEMAGDLFRNLGGRFRNIGGSSGTAYDASGNVHGGMGIDWGDYDNDGKLDLAVATYQNEPKCIYRNEGRGFFTERSHR